MAAETDSFLINSYFFGENSSFGEYPLLVDILIFQHFAEFFVETVPVIFNSDWGKSLHLHDHSEDAVGFLGDILLQAFALGAAHLNKLCNCFLSDFCNVVPDLFLVIGSFLDSENIGELNKL